MEVAWLIKQNIENFTMSCNWPSRPHKFLVLVTVIDFSFYCLYIHFLICHLSKACMDFQHNRIQYWILSFLLHVYVHVIMMWRPINAWESEEKTSFFVMSKVVIICESVSIKIHRNHLRSLKPNRGSNFHVKVYFALISF